MFLEFSREAIAPSFPSLATPMIHNNSKQSQSLIVELIKTEYSDTAKKVNYVVLNDNRKLKSNYFLYKNRQKARKPDLYTCFLHCLQKTNNLNAIKRLINHTRSSEKQKFFVTITPSSSSTQTCKSVIELF